MPTSSVTSVQWVVDIYRFFPWPHVTSFGETLFYTLQVSELHGPAFHFLPVDSRLKQKQSPFQGLMWMLNERLHPKEEINLELPAAIISSF